MKTSTTRSRHGLYFFGVLLSVLSFGTYLFLERYIRNNDSLFFVNYAFFVILLLTAFIQRALSFFGFTQPDKDPIVFPLMVTGTISCFALNKEVSVFYDSCTWLSAVLIAINIVVLTIPYISHFPKSLRYFFFAVLGFGWLIYLYFSIMMIPMYPMGLIAIIAIGLGLHIFIPFFCFVALTVFLLQTFRKERRMVDVSLFVIGLGILITIGYMIRWDRRIDLVNSFRQEMNLQKPGTLPDWVLIAQQLPADKLSKKVLLSDVMYANIGEFWGGGDFGMRRLNLETERVHDPLITLCSMGHDQLDISDDEIIKIMETKFDIRHLTEARLWTGRDLETNSVTTNVRIYPDLRLAYTEKILTVENNSENTWGSNEAIYTFYLPEGAAVSSLSLWIAGMEEKAALTTKGKADSAYTTIVGVENRDPSVVHWQESNKISVRVFPCQRREPRQFKIGITSPLEKEKGKLVYKNIYFKGPDASDAREIIQVNYTNEVKNLDQPHYFVKSGTRTFKSKHTYDDSWQVSFDVKDVMPNEYKRNNRSYSVEATGEQLEPFEASEIYLDVNTNWTQAEWTQMINASANKKIFVYTDELEKVTPENQAELFNRLQGYQFSLFPFFTIKDPEKAIVITKSNGLSPNLDELKGSDFSIREKEFFSMHKNIKVFNIQSTLTPYLKTLQEFRAIQLQNTSSDQISSHIKKNKFLRNPEDSNSVFIASAGITIHEKPVTTVLSNKSPDHVYRLYGYNTVLRQLNTDYYMQNNLDTAALATASDANVVSPISSLVVLETQQDYDRFGIKKNKDGLGNANMHSDGSVPEPHEWVLIIVVTISLWYIYNKKSTYAFRRY